MRIRLRLTVTVLAILAIAFAGCQVAHGQLFRGQQQCGPAGCSPQSGYQQYSYQPAQTIRIEPVQVIDPAEGWFKGQTEGTIELWKDGFLVGTLNKTTHEWTAANGKGNVCLKRALTSSLPTASPPAVTAAPAGNALSACERAACQGPNQCAAGGMCSECSRCTAATVATATEPTPPLAPPAAIDKPKPDSVILTKNQAGVGGLIGLIGLSAFAAFRSRRAV